MFNNFEKKLLSMSSDIGMMQTTGKLTEDCCAVQVSQHAMHSCRQVFWQPKTTLECPDQMQVKLPHINVETARYLLLPAFVVRT